MNNAQAIAQAFYLSNADHVREDNRTIWAELLDTIMQTAPSGSGIDSGTQLDEDKSSANRLVFLMPFHHMNENGMYDGWTEHTCIVTPIFGGFDVRITGRNRNGIKDYLGEVYQYWLSQECEYTYQTARTALGIV